MAYKILSLDGGGSWSLIQARVLLDMYGDINGHELLRKFNLAIANSGGSLVLACLCNDMKMSEIINVFQDENLRKQVFSV
ncbi:MAG: patatin-like phospholipase family protein, partial [Parafilimonas sp.]